MSKSSTKRNATSAIVSLKIMQYVSLQGKPSASTLENNVLPPMMLSLLNNIQLSDPKKALWLLIRGCVKEGRGCLLRRRRGWWSWLMMEIGRILREAPIWTNMVNHLTISQKDGKTTILMRLEEEYKLTKKSRNCIQTSCYQMRFLEKGLHLIGCINLGFCELINSN